MAYTQAQMLADFRDHLGDVNNNQKTDYQLIGALRRAYETAWPDWYTEVRDDATYTGYASLPPGTLSVPVPTSLVGGKIYNIFGRTNQYSQGVAFTSYGQWFQATTAHGLSNNQQVQLDGNSLSTGVSSNTLYYAVIVAPTFWVNSNITNGSANFGLISTAPAIGAPVVLSVTAPTNFTIGTTYYVATRPDNITITLSATRGGTPIVSGSTTAGVTITQTTTTTNYFQLATTSGGTPITTTTVGTGYVGNYVISATDYKPFNRWTRGIEIDPLTSTSPRIRFTQRDNLSFEIRLKGAGQLSYPSIGVTAANSATFTVTGTYTPTVNDTVFFNAVAPVNFTSGGQGAGGLTPYYIISTGLTATTFQLAATLGGAAITTTSTGAFTIYPGSQTLPGTDYQWFATFLRWQGEVFARAGLQRSGNLDRRAQAQRRLLAQQEAVACRSHRMQPVDNSFFSWDG